MPSSLWEILYDIYKSPDIIRSARISRLRRTRHVKRMEEDEIQKRVLEYKVQGRRRVGRLRLWLKGCVRRDGQKFGVKNWWMMTKDRGTWRMKPRVEQGCIANNVCDDVIVKQSKTELCFTSNSFRKLKSFYENCFLMVQGTSYFHYSFIV